MQSQTRSTQGKLAWLDALIGLGLALAAVLYGNSTRIPAGAVHQFLQARITVFNALFAGMFMLAWLKCFAALDLYRTELNGSLNKLIWIVQRCALITSFLVGYLYLSHTKGPIPRIAVIFWVSSIFYEVGRVFGATWIASRDPQLVVILGSGRRAGKAWRQIRTQYHSTVKLVGFVD